MCGIAGLISSRHHTFDGQQLIKKMTDHLEHRGPDGSGHASISIGERHVAHLGHRRLSILDLSDAGAQPMTRGQWTVTYNGEIYNAPALKNKLERLGRNFSTTCDTEVLCQALETWGPTQTIPLLEGMFAFAATNGTQVILARDGVGIKPLFWCKHEDGIAFASELKALKILPGFSTQLCHAALDRYLSLGHVPAPWTIFEGTEKLLPGHTLTWSPSSGIDITQWWSPLDSVNPGPADETHALDTMESLLAQSVEGQMMSDVPLGAFLSGGIDSSLVCTVTRRVLDRPLKTFSIGFDTPEYDESKHAEVIAKELGTEHTTLIMTEDDMLDLVPHLPNIYDEPFSDSSSLPTLLLSSLTKQHVTVALSGDGGDEFFRGYRRHKGYQLLQKYDDLHPIVRRFIGGSLDRIFGDSSLGRRGRAMNYQFREESLMLFVGQFHRIDFEALRGYDFSTRRGRLIPALKRLDKLANLADSGPLMDQILYLPDDILVKVDRASMHHSLEVRVPLLDRQVCEFANGLPPRLTYGNGVQKVLLKRLLGRHLDPSLWERPKMGFGVPLNEWLRGPLLQQMKTLLSPDRIRDQGLLNPDLITNLMNKHLNGGEDHCYTLWCLFSLQLWLDQAEVTL